MGPVEVPEVVGAGVCVCIITPSGPGGPNVAAFLPRFPNGREELP